MSADQAQFSGRVVAERYRLGQRRGTGVDAAVFDAFDQQLGRRVTLKVVHPDLVARPGFEQRFRAAMDVAAAVKHPNAAAVFDWGSDVWNDRGVLYVAVEHLGGGSLREMIDRGRRFSPSQVLIVGLDVCKALDLLHRRGAAHGDIRPSTLVFGDDGTVRVVDVGLGLLLAEETWSDPSQITNERASYAAPELGSERRLEPAGDIYSLCLTLLEAADGQLPFVGDSVNATLANRVGRLMPVNADLGALAAVLERAGRPDPTQRYTAAEFGRALVQAAEKMPRPEPIRPIAQAADRTGAIPRIPTVAAVPAVAAAPPIAAAQPAADGGDASVPDDAVTVHDPADPTFPARRPSLRVVADPVDEPAALAPAVPATPAATTAPVAPAVPTAAPVAPTTVPAAPMTVRVAAPEPEAVPSSNDDDGSPVVRRGVSRRALALIAVGGLVVGGAAGWWTTRVASHDVPQLAGLDEGQARNQVSDNKWRVVSVAEASDDIAAGVVIRSEPATGVLDEGETLTLFVSSGPAPRVLPELTGQTLATAEAAARKLDLVLIQAEAQFDENVPAGTVLSWRVPEAPTLVAGGTVMPGTSVEVTLSAGPAPRVVPDLTSLTPEQANAALAAVGLTGAVAPATEFSPTVPAGQIMAQSPAGGDEVERGATVTYTVSKGPDLVAVPNVDRLTLEAARAALEAAGLTVGQVTGNPGGVVILSVVGGQPVTANQQVLRGSAVDLTLF